MQSGRSTIEANPPMVIWLTELSIKQITSFAIYENMVQAVVVILKQKNNY